MMMMMGSMNSDDCSDLLECRCPTVISNGSLHVLWYNLLQTLWTIACLALQHRTNFVFICNVVELMWHILCYSRSCIWNREASLPHPAAPPSCNLCISSNWTKLVSTTFTQVLVLILNLITAVLLVQTHCAFVAVHPDWSHWCTHRHHTSINMCPSKCFFLHFPSYFHATYHTFSSLHTFSFSLNSFFRLEPLVRPEGREIQHSEVLINICIWFKFVVYTVHLLLPVLSFSNFIIIWDLSDGVPITTALLFTPGSLSVFFFLLHCCHIFAFFPEWSFLPAVINAATTATTNTTTINPM